MKKSTGGRYMKLGRPLKGSTRRNPITIYAPEETLKKIEEYIEQRESETGKSYSRSDFYQEAAAAFLKAREIQEPKFTEDGRRILTDKDGNEWIVSDNNGEVIIVGESGCTDPTMYQKDPAAYQKRTQRIEEQTKEV